jgi:chromate reductase
MTNLLLFSGSQRRDSFNTRLLRYFAEHLKEHCKEPCILDMIEPHQIDLPLFNQDLEDSPAVIEPVIALHRRFSASHGMVVASPEYNGQLSAYLKNIVDWVSRLPHIDRRFDNPFIDRPVLLCSASTGWSGGAVALPQARALFGYVGGVVIGDSICLPYADQAWTGDSYLFDHFFDQHIRAATDRVVRLARAFADSKAGRP